MSSQSFNSASSSPLLVDGVPGEPGLDGKVHSFPISFHCQKLFNLLSHIKFVVQVVYSLSFGKYELLNVDKPESKFKATFQGFKILHDASEEVHWKFLFIKGVPGRAGADGIPGKDGEADPRQCRDTLIESSLI